MVVKVDLPYDFQHQHIMMLNLIIKGPENMSVIAVRLCFKVLTHGVQSQSPTKSS